VEIETNTLASFALIVNVAPGTHQGARSAYHFAKAVIHQGHRILSVFFYGQGVLNANQLVSPRSAEANLCQAWNEFAYQHQVPLKVCSAALDYHGVSSEMLISQASRAGLVEVMRDLADADRTLVFHA
jgi:tRNA 2-thiouridine synthesizing protein D